MANDLETDVSTYEIISRILKRKRQSDSDCSPHSSYDIINKEKFKVFVDVQNYYDLARSKQNKINEEVKVAVKASTVVKDGQTLTEIEPVNKQSFRKSRALI